MGFDLATAQQVQALEAKVDKLCALLATKPAADDEPLWDVQRVADYTKFDRRTVEAWVREGRYDQGTGKKVYLPALEYNGRFRFKRADVEAFGVGIGVLASRAAGEQPAPTKPAPGAKQPKKPKAPVASEQALKVA